MIACGRAGSSLRKRGKAEEGNVEELVADAVRKQFEDAEDMKEESSK